MRYLTVLIALLNLATASAAPPKPMQICTLEHWPPFVDQSVLKSGFAVQVVDEALQLAGISFQRNYVPWARAMEETRSGNCDVISELYFDPERKHWADFSDAYGDLSMTLFARSDRNLSYQQLSDLTQYRVGLLRGANISPEFHRTEGMQLVPLKSVKQGLKLVYSGRIDAFVTGEKAIRYAMYKLQNELPEISNVLVPVYPAIHTNELFLGFNKLGGNNQEWRQRFNKALQQLKASGRYQQILQEQHLVFK